MWLGVYFPVVLEVSLLVKVLLIFFVVHTQPSVLSQIYVQMERVYLLIPQAREYELPSFDNFLI